MASDYDIGRAFHRIENELMASAIRNLKRHKIEEVKERKEWSQWQIIQLQYLEEYKRENRKIYGQQFKDINSSIDELIRQYNEEGQAEQEIEILEAIKKGARLKHSNDQLTGEFFRLNQRKLNALIQETTSNMRKAETAILRMSNDKYRQVIFDAMVYANTGAGTYEKAVDMATKDYRSAGLNCVEYKNGRRVSLESYARMALRTGCKRAYLQGEGTKRQEWGVSTVIMNNRGIACPKCFKFQGKILIDDVWSGGKPSDGPYMLMSTAIQQGLYHPNCKDHHTTFFPGVSRAPKKPTKKARQLSLEDYEREQKENYVKNEAQRCKRLSEFALDKENKEQYAKRAEEWEKRLEQGKVTDGSGKTFQITQSAIDNMELPDMKNLMDIKEQREYLDMHKKVLQISMEQNRGYEVAYLANKNMEQIGECVLGSRSEINLNVTGRTQAKYVVHNHPNNSSFSDRDIRWFIENEQTKFFSIAKNSGKIEVLIKEETFDIRRLLVEWKRAEKKFQKEIAKNDQTGYTKVVNRVLESTKSGIKWLR